jgi:hypothetical protein
MRRRRRREMRKLFFFVARIVVILVYIYIYAECRPASKRLARGLVFVVLKS